jgi:hypothetical protein
MSLDKDKPDFNTGIMSAFTLTQVASNKTIFFGYGQSANEHDVHLISCVKGILHDLHTHSNIAPGAGLSFTYEIYVNGVGTGIIVTVSGAVDKIGENETDHFLIDHNDQVSVRLITPIGGGVSRHTASWKVEIRA